MPDDDDSDIVGLKENIKRTIRKYIHGILRIITGLIIILIFIHEVYPELLSAISDKIGIKEDHLITTIILLISIQLMDGQFRIKEKIDNPSISSYATEVLAYEHLCDLLKARRRVDRVDLLQVSGRTAYPFLTTLANLHPKAYIRLLLIHDDLASKFDNDDKPGEHYNHVERTAGTISDLMTLQNRNRVTVKYYRSYPGVCSVRIDNDVVCLGWYRTFFDSPNVIRIRSHDAPAVVASQRGVEPMLSFSKNHFEQVWKHAETSKASRVLTRKEM